MVSVAPPVPPVKTPLARNFLLIFAGTLAVLLAANWSYYFSTPFHEQGDTALNALQIDGAKGFHELYGNYSRFRFHHPGPAFFYAYAGSELLWCDGLKSGLSPYNAHSLAGLAIQAAFFALALALAAQWVRSRLFLPLALLAAAIHFAIAGNAFWSIWPPHVLLMPFLAFWLACLSVACGRGEHLGWAVLAGSVLVHGHVAQPLFVGVLFVISYGLLLARLRRASAPGRPWSVFPRTHLAAAIILAVFVAPLLLDLLRGEESNFAQIVRHLQDNTEQMKKPLKSLLYVTSFFGYVHDQDELLRELSPASLRFFGEHWVAFAAAVAALLAAAFALPALRRADPDSAPWWRTGLALWLVTLGLGLLWGILQAGRMYEFNSYFFYATNYLVLLPPAAWLAGRLEAWRGTRSLAGTVLLAAAGCAAWGFAKPPVTPGEAGLEVLTAVRQAAGDDPQPGLPKLLVFDHDEWPQAATVALALQRLGRPYLVDDPWWFMFSRQRTVPAAILRENRPAVSTWRLLKCDGAVRGRPLGNGVTLVRETPVLEPTGGAVDFSLEGSYLQFLVAGFSNLHGDYAWICQDNAVLQFQPAASRDDVLLDFSVVPYLPPGGQAMPPLEVYFNGRLLDRATLTQPGHLVCRVPRAQWTESPVATLRLFLAGAHNPFEPGLAQSRSFGSLSVRRLVTRPAVP